MLAVCGPYTIVFFMIVVFFGAFYLINLMLAVVAMSYDDEAHVNSQSEKEKNSAKTLTDYREESTFSFDPGKLPLVLLEKGYQQSQSQLMKARKKQLQANRNKAGGTGFGASQDDDDDGDHDDGGGDGRPQVAQIVWALAKTDAVKLEKVKAAASSVSCSNKKQPAQAKKIVDAPRCGAEEDCEEADEESKRTATKDRMAAAVAAAAATDPVVIVEKEDEEDQEGPLGFTLQVMEPPPGDDDGNEGVVSLFQQHQHPPSVAGGGGDSGNFASSFNTDVGYSSETTSRAPSYPSSVVFKRRNYTSKQSVSQNYSSLTESIGSREAAIDCASANGESGDECGHLHHHLVLPPGSGCGSGSGNDDRLLLDIHRRPGGTGSKLSHTTIESRRLSYKRACDPDKRISMALIEAGATGSSSVDSSARSDVVTTVYSPIDRAVTMTNIINHNGGSSGGGGKESEQVKRQQQQQQEQQLNKTATLVTNEDADQWLKRRQSYHRTSRRVNQPFDHYQHHHQDELHQTRRHRRHHVFSVHCIVTVVRCVRNVLDRLVQSPWMDFVITISIVLNTAFLAAEHHGMSPDVKHVLDVGNKVSSRFIVLLLTLTGGPLLLGEFLFILLTYYGLFIVWWRRRRRGAGVYGRFYDRVCPQVGRRWIGLFPQRMERV